MIQSRVEEKETTMCGVGWMNDIDNGDDISETRNFDISYHMVIVLYGENEDA